MDDHVASETLAQFVAGTLPADASADVFGHLAFCEDCRLRVHALRTIAADPESAWNRLAGGGDDAGAGNLWATLRIVVDAVRGLASITVAHAGDALSGGGGGNVAPMPRAILVGDDASVGRVAADEPRVEMRLEDAAFGAATVVADARRDAIAVLLYPHAGREARQQLLDRRPRAVLIDDHGRRCHLAGFEPVEGADYLLAEFEHPDGTTWTLGLEGDA